MDSLASFQERLGYTFQNSELLRIALTHPSVAHEMTSPIQHNQRLEFLGDAVLGLILARALYEKFPGLGEGPLTQARAQLVNRRMLAAQARNLGLGSELRLSRGEETTGGRSRPSGLADAFEAVIGAIFIDGGFAAAETFVLQRFQESFGDLGQIPNLENPKGELQERLQATSEEAPQYQLTSIEGPDHDRVFEATVSHSQRELGRGRGKSKKEAEIEAASAALKKLKSEPAS